MIRIFKNCRPLLKFRIDESVENIFDLFKKQFPADVVDSTKMNFEFDSRNLFIIFDILNFHFFNGALDRIQFAMCSAEDFKELLLNIGKEEDAKFEYYAVYMPQYTNAKNEQVMQTIFIIDSYGKMTFKFAVSCLLHEMIHYYDFTLGDMSNMVKNGKYRRGAEHATDTFNKYMAFARQEGIKVMPNGYGKKFEKLNIDAAEFKPVDESGENAGWADMVNRLKAGEDIPGVALAPNGNVVFIVT